MFIKIYLKLIFSRPITYGKKIENVARMHKTNLYNINKFKM